MNEVDSLRRIVKSVLLWAKTPGNHGGNPYMYDFVKLSCGWEDQFGKNSLELKRTFLTPRQEEI